jgi:hypothetical protein
VPVPCRWQKRLGRTTLFRFRPENAERREGEREFCFHLRHLPLLSSSFSPHISLSLFSTVFDCLSLCRSRKRATNIVQLHRVIWRSRMDKTFVLRVCVFLPFVWSRQFQSGSTNSIRTFNYRSFPSCPLFGCPPVSLGNLPTDLLSAKCPSFACK